MHCTNRLSFITSLMGVFLWNAGSSQAWAQQAATIAVPQTPLLENDLREFVANLVNAHERRPDGLETNGVALWQAQKPKQFETLPISQDSISPEINWILGSAYATNGPEANVNSLTITNFEVNKQKESILMMRVNGRKNPEKYTLIYSKNENTRCQLKPNMVYLQNTESTGKPKSIFCFSLSKLRNQDDSESRFLVVEIPFVDDAQSHEKHIILYFKGCVEGSQCGGELPSPAVYLTSDRNGE
jgi:hypothetical protein